LFLSKILGKYWQICPPIPLLAKGRERRQNNNIQSGSERWTKSEHFLSKIQRILLIDPPSGSPRSSRGRQSPQKLKHLLRGARKNNWKNFLLCSPSGECRRWVGLAPPGRAEKKQGRDFFFKKYGFFLI
jgi:hypothetical protein